MSSVLLTCKVVWGDGKHIHLHFYRQASTCSAPAPSPAFEAYLSPPFPLDGKKEGKKTQQVEIVMILYAIWYNQNSLYSYSLLIKKSRQ